MKQPFTIAALIIFTLFLAACNSPAMPQEIQTIDTGIDPNSWATIPVGGFLSGQHPKLTNVVMI